MAKLNKVVNILLIIMTIIISHSVFSCGYTTDSTGTTLSSNPIRETTITSVSESAYLDDDDDDDLPETISVLTGSGRIDDDVVKFIDMVWVTGRDIREGRISLRKHLQPDVRKPTWKPPLPFNTINGTLALQTCNLKDMLTLFRAILVIYWRQLEDCRMASNHKLSRLELIDAIQSAFNMIIRYNDRGLFFIISRITDLSKPTWHLDTSDYDRIEGATSYCSTAESSLEYERRVLQVINGLYLFYRKYFRPMLNKVFVPCYPRSTTLPYRSAVMEDVVTVLIAVLLIAMIASLIIYRYNLSRRTRASANEVSMESGTVTLYNPVTLALRSDVSPPGTPQSPIESCPLAVIALVSPLNVTPKRGVSREYSVVTMTTVFQSQ